MNGRYMEQDKATADCKSCHILTMPTSTKTHPKFFAIPYIIDTIKKHLTFREGTDHVLFLKHSNRLDNSAERLAQQAPYLRSLKIALAATSFPLITLLPVFNVSIACELTWTRSIIYWYLQLLYCLRKKYVENQ